jgi:hypothetical protein
VFWHCVYLAEHAVCQARAGEPTGGADVLTGFAGEFGLLGLVELVELGACAAQPDFALDTRSTKTAGTVSWRAQSRCSSQASETQLIGCPPERRVSSRSSSPTAC